LVYNKSVLDKDWKMTPFVHNYDSLLKTLESGGYQNGKDLLIWNYDWRRPLNSLVEKLDTYISNNIGTEDNFVIIGHSMGGVVGRLWYQNHTADSRVKQVISAGSPQSGAMDPYTMWNSGRVASGDSVTTVALNILLQLHQDKFDTKVKVLRNFVPSMADLIPVYDFVKKNGKVVGYENIVASNSYLANANQNADSIYPNYRAIVGTGYGTPAWILLGERDLIDKVLGYWPDGSLKSYIKGDGDGTVLAMSQYFTGDPNYSVKSSHGEITDKALGEIASIVGIGQTVKVPGIDLGKTRVYFIGSPAVIHAKCENVPEKQSDDLGFLLLGSDDLNCKIWVEGLSSGTYHLVIGEGGNYDSWRYFEKETSAGKIEKISENKPVFDRKFIIDIIKSDLNKLSLKKLEPSLDKGDVLEVLKKVLQYRRKNRETAVSTRLIVNLEGIVDKKRLMLQPNSWMFHLNKFSYKKLNTIDALNMEMAKNYMEEARDLYWKNDFWTVLRKMVVANMLVSIR